MSLSLKGTERMEDGDVLGRRGDEMTQTVAARQDHTFQGQVVRLRRRGCKENLLCRCVKERPDRGPGALDSVPRGAASGVRARGVAERLPQERQHGLENLR